VIKFELESRGCSREGRLIELSMGNRKVLEEKARLLYDNGAPIMSDLEQTPDSRFEP
jgi:hypothetical protein